MLSFLSAESSKIAATVDVTFLLAFAAAVAPLTCPWLVPKVLVNVFDVEVAFDAAVTDAIELIPPIVIVNWFVLVKFRF